MTDPVLVTADDDGILTITLNAPETSNALSEHMLVALSEVFADIPETTERVRAVVVAGAGPTLCAGHDLHEIRAAQDAAAEDQRAYFADLFGRTAALMMRIATIPQPVVALAHGTVAAAGLQLVASADLALAAPGASFRLDEPRTGLFGAAPLVALLGTMPRKILAEMLHGRRPLSAAEAARFGLVNRVVPEARLLADGVALAAELGPPACAIGKPALLGLSGLPPAEAYARAAEGMAETLSRAPARAALAAALLGQA